MTRSWFSELRRSAGHFPAISIPSRSDGNRKSKVVVSTCRPSFLWRTLARTLRGAIVLVVALASHTKASANPYLEERFPEFHALVFANSDYVEVEQIESVQADGKLVRSTLRSLGFKTYDGMDGIFATKGELYEKINAILAQGNVSEGDVVLFYYSGHGFSWGGYNYLLPLTFPKTVANSQRLPFDTPYLGDVVKKIRSAKPGLILTILDSCREDVPFKVSRFGKVKTALAQNQANSFGLVRGMAVEAWYATSNRGQSLGGDRPDVPSIFTKHLADLFIETGRSVPARFELLRYRVVEETIGAMTPQRTGLFSMSSFEFSKDGADWDGMKKEWERSLRLRSVESFLTLYPWSQYSKAAKEWLSNNRNGVEPNRQVDQLLVERGFDEVFRTNKLAGIIRNNFSVKYPLISSQETVLASNEKSAEELGVVSGDSVQEVYEQAKELIETFAGGNKRTYDFARLQERGEIANTRIGRFKDASTTALEGILPPNTFPAVTLQNMKDLPGGGASATLRRFTDIIGSSVFEARDVVEAVDIGSLLPKVEIAYEPASNPEDFTLIIGRALSEILVPEADHDKVTEVQVNVLKQELIRLKRDRKTINRVAIAPTLIPSVTEADIPANLSEREASRYRERLELEYRQAYAARELRTAHIREILIENGIRRDVITVAPGSAGDIGLSTRVRFLGF